jgi:hypothetical protein
LAWGCGLDSTVSGQVPVAGCCECGDEPSCSCATELYIYIYIMCVCVYLYLEFVTRAKESRL